MSAPERRPLPSPLLVVTDRHGHPRPLVETVQAVLAAGARWIWLRDKDMAADDRHRLAEAVAECVRTAGGVLTVGGDPALAARLGADGVHLPGGTTEEAIRAAQRVLRPGALVGISAHGPGDLAVAARAGADYATLSPTFETASKPGYGPALGLAGLREMAGIGLPVIALGGIAPDAVPACRAAGAAGIAIMGGVMRAADPGAATRTYLDRWAGTDARA
ncbi:thiamine phosphate synthase [Methylobacterium trifolii]|uniref:Thiamine-phosphate synthase n=1 Tax=Methylobacterium trifolii TaxID=1003092 RepID=A0ABQ4U4T2_9HYPH|nr:thiamine phosphate synthase [Methylobacterium trifolii]GJE61842.1 Thiamine-phosphate synthase [Methylobacterium trifolii]